MIANMSKEKQNINKIAKQIRDGVLENSLNEIDAIYKNNNKKGISQSEEIIQEFLKVMDEIPQKEIAQEGRSFSLSPKTEASVLKVEVEQLNKSVKKHFDKLKREFDSDLVSRRLDEKINEMEDRQQKAYKIKNSNKRSTVLERLANELYGLTTIKLRDSKKAQDSIEGSQNKLVGNKKAKGEVVEDVLFNGATYSKINKTPEVVKNKSQSDNKKQTSVAIDKNKGKKSKKQTKKDNMKMKNPYGMPNPNAQNTEDYNVTKSEKQRIYTQEDIDNAAKDAWVDMDGYKGVASKDKSLENKESTEALQAQKLELNKKRSELLTKGTTKEEFQANQRKLEAVQDKLKARGADYSTLKDTLNNHGEKTDSGKIKGDKPKKESRDTDMNEEEKFDKEVARRKAEGDIEEINPEAVTEIDESTAEVKSEDFTKIDKGKAQQEGLEQLKNALDDARGVFANKNYKNNNAWAHVGKMLGLKKRDGDDPDMQVVKENYYNALKKYQEARLTNIKEMLPADQEALAKDMFKFNAEEAGKLFDGYTEAKADSFSNSKIMKGISRVGKFLTENKTGKLMMKGSVALGVISGGVRVALGQMPKVATKFGANETVISGLEKVAFASKFLAPIGAGVAVGGLVEKWQKVRYENKENEEKKKFEDMTADEQMMQLMDFNQKSFDKIIKTMGKRINRRRLSVLAGGLTTVAAFAITGDFDMSAHEDVNTSIIYSPEELAQEVKYGESVFDAMSQDFTDEMQRTKAFEIFEEKYGPDAYGEYLQNGGDASKWQKKVENAVRLYTASAENQLESSVVSTGVESVDVPDERSADGLTRTTVGGLHEGPGTPWLEEGLAAAKELPVTDRDKMEEYLISLNQGETIQGGIVNEELLQQRAQEAFSQYHLTGEVPGIAETVAAVDVDAVDVDVAMEQIDASGTVDNPLSQRFSGIEITANGNGLLTVEAGRSVNRELANFLEQNPKQVLNDMSGWSNERVRSLVEQANQITDTSSAEYKSVIHELSGIRADVISREFMTDNPSIDLGTVKPDTDFELKFTELDGGRMDISITQVDKPHIIPTQEKIVFDNEAETGGEPTLGEESNVETKTVAEESLNEISESNRFDGMTEIEIIRELMENPGFNNALGKQIQEVFNISNISNISNIPLSEYLEDRYTDKDTQLRLIDVISRAKDAFGDNVGEPQKGTSVSRYFTRMFAQAVKEDKIADVFPSSTFKI